MDKTFNISFIKPSNIFSKSFTNVSAKELFKSLIKFFSAKTDLLVIGAISLIYLLIAQRIEFSFSLFLQQLPEAVFFITEEMLPVNWESYSDYLSPLLDTFCVAIISLVFSSVISFLLGFLCSEKTMHIKWVRTTVKGFMTVIRNVPNIIWALMLVPAFGVGITTGVIALTVGNIGSMTRFYYETIDEVDLELLTSLKATGMSYIQVIRFGAIPQALPGFISWTIYSLENNIRSSSIIGLVGAGGVGMYISNNLSLMKYKTAAMGIILIVVCVIITEIISNILRKRII
ncbi:MAG: phosphonate ABC transporter, permease protein PhnE [Fusobacteriaceae bacterium]